MKDDGGKYVNLLEWLLYIQSVHLKFSLSNFLWKVVILRT